MDITNDHGELGMSYRLNHLLCRKLRPIFAVNVVLGLMFGAMACQGFNDPLPAGSQDPSYFNTADGAQLRYRGAKRDFWSAYRDYIEYSGLFSDELHAATIGAPVGQDLGMILLDTRRVTENSPIGLDGGYRLLHAVRHSTSQAIKALELFSPNSSTELLAELYSMSGFAEIMLADMFCSGIPLSTIDFDSDYTYTRGFTTQEVYQHAITLFDSALFHARDSVGIAHFARLGKGRALLALGKYVAADSTVNSISTSYRYGQPLGVQSDTARFFHRSGVGDVEGEVGLPFRSWGDPRTAIVQRGVGQYGAPLFLPAKYLTGANAILLAAHGVDARLIQAEAALQRGDAGAWLTILNDLRTDETFNVVGDDTVWHAGSGGVAGLAPLNDPGLFVTDAEQAFAKRVDLHFQERAAWLFAEGRRQGDLRRLIREYGRLADDLYPRGAYPGGPGVYGSDVTMPIPSGERLNTSFTGCLGRDA